MPVKQENKGNICPLCLKFKNGPRGPFCNGHSKSAGGGASGGGRDNAPSQPVASGVSAPLKANTAAILTQLLKDKVLTITNDRESSVLTISCIANLLSAEQKEAVDTYTNKILSLFEQFKNEHGVTGFFKRSLKDKHGKVILCLVTPNEVLHNKFIAMMVENNLLPASVLNPSQKATPGFHQPHENEHQQPADNEKQQSGTKLNPFDIHRGPKFRGN